MTELYIDGQLVSLSSDFKIDYFIKNPFFTKQGEFTYDISINLSDPRNKKIYKHIDRINNILNVSGRTAVIIDKGRVVVRGTEIVLNVEDDIVKIQIVAGNSELNYLSYEDVSLRSLDFGKLTVDRTIAKATLDGTYPTYNFVCPPIYTGYEDSSFKFSNQMQVGEDSTTYLSDTIIIPQPYYLYYVEKLIELLGYTLSHNYLRDDERWKRLIVVNGNNTNDYAKMLPDWTVNKFITETEKLMNCIFLVDQYNKSVVICYVDSYYKNSNTVYIDKYITNEMTKKFDASDNLYLNYANVSYKFPAQTEYKYDCSSKEIVNTCEVVNLESYLNVWNYAADYDKLKIFHTSDYNLDFVLIKGTKYNVPGTKQRVFNRFKELTSLADESMTELEIIPAEIYAGVSGMGDVMMTSGGFTAPFARNTISQNESDTPSGLTDIIINGIPKEDAPDHIYVAFYLGMQGLFATGGLPTYQFSKYKLPMCATDLYYYIYADTYDNLIKHKNNALTLVLAGDDGLYENLYKNNVNVDLKTEYVIKFMSKKLYDAKSIFVINNMKFYCKELHYEIGTDGINNVIEGTFYPILQ